MKFGDPFTISVFKDLNSSPLYSLFHPRPRESDSCPSLFLTHPTCGGWVGVYAWASLQPHLAEAWVLQDLDVFDPRKTRSDELVGARTLFKFVPPGTVMKRTSHG